MYDEKISFLLYKEWGDYVRMLTDEERGKLLIAIFNFQDTGEVPEFNGQLKMVFTMMIKQFELDDKKWIEQKAKRSEAGKKGAEARWDNTNSIDVVKALSDKFSI